MKSIRIYRTTFFALFASLIMGSALLTACSKDDNDTSENYNTTGTASGSQQNPPVTSTGSATLTGTYNATTNLWQYSINWTGLAAGATVIEFRGPADIGVNGSLVLSITITGGGTSGTINNSVTLTADQEAHLLADKLYYTILNATHVTGEVRGQITATSTQ
jgi:hypothetical protein